MQIHCQAPESTTKITPKHNVSKDIIFTIHTYNVHCTFIYTHRPQGNQFKKEYNTKS